MKSIIKNERGITISSLVITVLILIILLGLIDLIIPEGFLQKTKEAENQTESIIEESQNKIDALKNEYNAYVN